MLWFETQKHTARVLPTQPWHLVLLHIKDVSICCCRFTPAMWWFFTVQSSFMCQFNSAPSTWNQSGKTVHGKVSHRFPNSSFVQCCFTAINGNKCNRPYVEHKCSIQELVTLVWSPTHHFSADCQVPQNLIFLFPLFPLLGSYILITTIF